MSNEYVQFRVHDMVRFQQFITLFEHLKRDKEQNQIDDPSIYLPYFDETARSYFWWPTEAEYQAWLKQWYATPVETRLSDPSLKQGWLFEAMIDSFRNGEYDLLGCHLIAQDNARLEFYALAYPYGGTGCMQALIEAFGFVVTEIDDGSQPPFSPQVNLSDEFRQTEQISGAVSYVETNATVIACWATSEGLPSWEDSDMTWHYWIYEYEHYVPGTNEIKKHQETVKFIASCYGRWFLLYPKGFRFPVRYNRNSPTEHIRLNNFNFDWKES